MAVEADAHVGSLVHILLKNQSAQRTSCFENCWRQIPRKFFIETTTSRTDSLGSWDGNLGWRGGGAEGGTLNNREIVYTPLPTGRSGKESRRHETNPTVAQEQCNGRDPTQPDSGRSIGLTRRRWTRHTSA